MFESIRTKQKGGTVIGVHKSLDPILIEEYSDDFELLVVEATLGGQEVRIISGYGPQENWRIAERMPFFRALEEEIVTATSNDKAVYIQMDANSKLGPQIIEGDPHEQSENGKILAGIIDRHALSVINGSKKQSAKERSPDKETQEKKKKRVLLTLL